MGTCWPGYDIGIVGKNAFVVTVKLNYLAYVETTTPNYRQIYSATQYLP
jgi:hypothetical protein